MPSDALRAAVLERLESMDAARAAACRALLAAPAAAEAEDAEAAGDGMVPAEEQVAPASAAQQRGRGSRRTAAVKRPASVELSAGEGTEEESASEASRCELMRLPRGWRCCCCLLLCKEAPESITLPARSYARCGANMCAARLPAGLCCCSEEDQEAESSGDDDFAAPPSNRRRRVGVGSQGELDCRVHWQYAAVLSGQCSLLQLTSGCVLAALGPCRHPLRRSSLARRAPAVRPRMQPLPPLLRMPWRSLAGSRAMQRWQQRPQKRKRRRHPSGSGAQQPSAVAAGPSRPRRLCRQLPRRRPLSRRSKRWSRGRLRPSQPRPWMLQWRRGLQLGKPPRSRAARQQHSSSSSRLDRHRRAQRRCAAAPGLCCPHYTQVLFLLCHHQPNRQTKTPGCFACTCAGR